MKVAVLGASGLVGREFSRQLSAQHDVLQLRHADLDVTDAEAVNGKILLERPHLIINCAVLGVDACERDPALAWAVNVQGTESLARAAKAVEAGFVQISTNYVFDGHGDRRSFFTQVDVPSPINVYGRTKLAGENAATAAERYFIIRSSWVFGTGKMNFLSSVVASLNLRRKIRAITDMRASATYVKDLVTRAIEIISHRRYSVYHVVNSGLCSYYEFAAEAARILEISDRELQSLIEPVKLSELRQETIRPVHTPLRCLESENLKLIPMRDWRVALSEFISEGAWK